jgi:hypothetical protein
MPFIDLGSVSEVTKAIRNITGDAQVTWHTTAEKGLNAIMEVPYQPIKPYRLYCRLVISFPGTSALGLSRGKLDLAIMAEKKIAGLTFIQTRAGCKIKIPQYTAEFWHQNQTGATGVGRSLGASSGPRRTTFIMWYYRELCLFKSLLNRLPLSVWASRKGAAG